jgi:hypothetical protein
MPRSARSLRGLPNSERVRPRVLYRRLPQVLIRAMAAWLSIVASEVRGVAAALDGGRAGLLVPPAELEPLVGPSFSSPKTKFCEQRVARLIDRISPLAKKPSLRHRTRVVNIGTATRMRGEGESVQRYRRLAFTIAVFPC